MEDDPDWDVSKSSFRASEVEMRTFERLEIIGSICREFSLKSTFRVD